MQQIINKLFRVRLLQMTLMLTIGLYFYVFSKIPHSWWVMMTIYLMIGSIEPGLVKSKSVARAKGTIVSLIIFFPLIYLLQLNYRFIPITLMFAIAAANTTSPRKYDVATMFVTLAILASTAYNFVAPTSEGPFQLSMNRSINTLLAIATVFAGEYFLFNRFNYAYKVYLLYQLQTRKALHKIYLILIKPQNKNSVIILSEISTLFFKVFNNLISASSSLTTLDKTAKLDYYEQILNFNHLAYIIRQQLLQLYTLHLILKDTTRSQELINEINHNMKLIKKWQLKN